MVVLLLASVLIGGLVVFLIEAGVRRTRSLAARDEREVDELRRRYGEGRW
ncbi:hypothetical protein ACH4GK_15520 [Streptomyces rimosus]|uniref:Secreted protein n=1 Tax=Streptomyces rimosus subsp. rimosus TaxID=132474 RepID=A0ABY3YTK8_STRRM|nr:MULTISPECIES: hypothetical protein [Streptomyces]UNZ01340.1 hypothetical protein SRIMR7_04230 [Streptomyces rimosus subsp. rimosus]